jgi:hypothetical protein
VMLNLIEEADGHFQKKQSLIWFQNVLWLMKNYLSR